MALRRPGAWLVVCAGLGSCAPAPSGPAATPAPGAPEGAATLAPEAARWVDETLASLSLRERVAQLVIEWIPGGYAAPTSPDFAPLDVWVADDGIGGVSPSIGTPHAYAAKLNALQRRAEVPLLVTADFESGGPGMRINGAYALPSMLAQGGGTDFPPTMAFGAIGDERFAYEYGRITAREARAVGVHLLFSPVLDVNSNPDNPVINTRSFGGDPALVARLGAAFIRGAHDGGALTTAKHFPGHGDTSVDSHVGLPVIDADRARLDRLELVPFRRAVEEGVDAVMTAHVSVPGVVPSGEPATLSPEFMTELLRGEMGFEGVLFTDALGMRAIADGYGLEEAGVRALEAGADVLLSPHQVGRAIDGVVAAVRSGRIDASRIDASVRRLLELKARLGLHRNRLVDLDAVDEVVGSGAHLAFADSAAARSITLVRDAARRVPLDPASGEGVLHLRYAPSTRLWADRVFGPGLAERLGRTLERVAVDERSDDAAWRAAREAVEAADRVVVSAYVPAGAGASPDALPEPFRVLVTEAARTKPTVLVSFGNPWLLSAVPEVSSYLVAWGDRPVSQRAALAALMGEADIRGRLPVDLPAGYPVGHGLDRDRVREFASAPEVESPLVAAGIVDEAPVPSGAHQDVVDPGTVGMDPARLRRIDALVRDAIADSAASGVAVAVGRHGRLVLLEGWGELAWGSGRPVTPTSIWDLASVSKVVGTTTMAMRMVGDGRLSLDDRVVEHLPWWAGPDPRKREVTVRQLLLHRAGLPPFRRWYLELEGGLGAYEEAVAAERLETAPGERTAYSDIGIMTLGWLLEEVAGAPLDVWLEREVWRPLGMLETGYLPDPALRPRIAATEMDTVWRKEMVWGRVHDENADAMGGVAGHAGLFSTAVDLSVFARTMLAGGEAPACRPGAVPGEPCPVARPESVRIVDERVLETFTRRFDGTSSRALGWDTPEGRSSGGDYVTPRAFGHTGYTGTSVWMDPELDLWVIVLTNRVHPTRANTKHVALRRAIADAAATAITDRAVRMREDAR